MRKVAIVGNSHVAALKSAYMTLGSDRMGKLSLTFFASRGKKLASLERRGNNLVPGERKLAEALRFTSGRDENIDCSKYDCIVLYGLGLKLRRWPGCYYSTSVVQAALSDGFASSTAANLAGKLSNIGGVRVVVVPDPLPADDIASESAVQAFREARFRLSTWLKKIHGLDFLCQPEATLGPGFNTASRLAVGSQRLAIGRENDGEPHPQGDIYHMNDEFGRIMLDQLRVELSQIT